MTGRTIPVTRTDGSEVASEATLDNIRLKTDNLDIALSALVMRCGCTPRR